MENLSVTWETALAIFGGVAVIAGGVKVIANLFSPYKKLKAQTDEHDRKLEKDYQRLTDLEEENRAFARALLALLDHEITGNSVDKLKDARAALQTYLIEK